MANTDNFDNQMLARAQVAPNTAAGGFTTAGPTAIPSVSTYVYGTVELGAVSLRQFQDAAEAVTPVDVTLGRIESCSIKETGDQEKMPDGGGGTEGVYFTELGFSCDLEVRFPSTMPMPRIGQIFTILAPEGVSLAPRRFYVSGEPTSKWVQKGWRMVSMSGEMPNSMALQALATARLSADRATVAAAVSAVPSGAGGDEV